MLNTRTSHTRRRRQSPGQLAAFLFLIISLKVPTTHGLSESAALARLENESPTTAILFPWFVEILGVVVFFLLTRFELPVPYAAVMFLVGVCMGFGAYSIESQSDEDDENPFNQLTVSIIQWSRINSGVLLLVFLPGLIFRDAIEVNYNLFVKALPQILILAFPMVLVGNLLTAVVAFYAMPFDWPLSLAATLGAVLSSTDPVAVGSVLKSAGAPPRLQMHISGESLLNDGSAVVFFSIFSTLYLAELGEGESVGWGEGFADFFRMAFGGTAVGLAFAIGLLLVLFELDRRLEPEYNVLQVVAALTFAYLSYYVSEQVCIMSGVIACVVCGITARALGRGMITDNHLMDSYLALMEFLLNTLLFTLGGVVYGEAIREDQKNKTWVDWMYVGLFYVLVMGIRFFQVTLFYPLFSRVGLKSNWSETLFLGFGGLRGAVGVALALSLDRRARESSTDPDVLEWTREMEFVAGGVTFLTLFVNGSLAGWVLKWLGLAKPAVSRKRTLRLFKVSAENFVNDEFVKLMQEKRFMRTDVRVIHDLVPFLTLDLPPPAIARAESGGLFAESHHFSRLATAASRQTTCPSETLQEIRGLYLDLLNEAYGEEISNNELDEREDNGFNFNLLRQSVKFAAADIDHQEPIHDWEWIDALTSPGPRTSEYSFFDNSLNYVRKQLDRVRGGGPLDLSSNYEFQKERAAVIRAISFIEAHVSAEKKLTSFVQSVMQTSLDDDDVALLVENAIDIVLQESAKQVAEAQNALDRVPPDHIDRIVSNHVATILLRRLAEFVERRANEGFLTKKEARLYLDKIDQNIRNAHDGNKSSDVLGKNGVVWRTRNGEEDIPSTDSE